LTFRESYRILIARLQPIFGGGETLSIARILYEDCFSMMSPATSDTRLSSDQIDTFEDASRRLLAGEPIDYITGIKEFYSRRFRVDASVLIPRPETEELVAWILEDLSKSSAQTILDIGTGSGCIPITLDLESSGIHDVYGMDISKAALSVANANNHALGSGVQFSKLDVLYEDLKHGFEVDVMVSNPPYILSSERNLMNEQVLDHEPDIALFTDGDDPLIFYRKINQVAIKHLQNGGALYYEISALHKEAMMALMKKDGFQSVEARKDISGNWRMIKAIKE